MVLKRIASISVTLIVFGLSVMPMHASACTGVQLKAKDGSVVNGRTIEFGISLDIGGLLIPRNYEFKGTLPDGSTGLTYKAKYAVVGGNMFGEQAIADGLNEQGLSVGSFYFPGFAVYANVTLDNKSSALSPTEFPNWLLTQFATIDEVKANLKSIVIVPTTPKGWPVMPPFHYVVYDKTGKSLVIEPIDGQLKVYDNPLGVITNSPTFDWHQINLANYINLSPINSTPIIADGLKLQQYGQGAGSHGLPGDFTSASRFVRAAFFASTAISSTNAAQGVSQTFHILNQFDIPVGSVRDVTATTMAPESTLATTVKDPQNLKYYFKTYDDQTIKVIDLNQFDKQGKALKFVSMGGPQSVIDVTKMAK